MEENKVNLEEETTAKTEETVEEAVESKEEVKEETETVETEASDKADKKDKEGLFKKRKKVDAKALEAELEKKEAEVADLKDRYQRLMAEFENARKRTAKETTRMFDMGAKDVLEKLLPVVDNFERGLAAVSEEEKDNAFVQGIDAIYKQLMTVFGEIGVAPMDAVGKEFNADFHNAVMHVEDEELGENIVAEEFQKGYMYKDQVLRHSMVKVAN
ncbi:MAG TPA: nucleotide exchange factor GrpE [Lachnospiraceae bacterium]|nr:nucleotide exchange factor GrpE [Lachnospiraceae bacterium]HIS62002.1 nucleotide exchange factor GrpE [Candidatus Scybalomonas excrementigallinarum]